MSLFFNEYTNPLFSFKKEAQPFSSSFFLKPSSFASHSRMLSIVPPVWKREAERPLSSPMGGIAPSVPFGPLGGGRVCCAAKRRGEGERGEDKLDAFSDSVLPDFAAHRGAKPLFPDGEGRESSDLIREGEEGRVKPGIQNTSVWPRPPFGGETRGTPQPIQEGLTPPSFAQNHRFPGPSLPPSGKDVFRAGGEALGAALRAFPGGEKGLRSPVRSKIWEQGKVASLPYTAPSPPSLRRVGDVPLNPYSAKLPMESMESRGALPYTQQGESFAQKEKAKQQIRAFPAKRVGEQGTGTREVRDGGPQLKGGFAKENKVVSITYEEIGLFPRSFSRVFDRFVKQLFSDVENLVLQEYRFYRYLFLTTVKCVFILLFVPFLVNFLAKNYLVRPLTEYFWNTKQTEIFLNSYQQKHAFAELQDYEEKLYFDHLILPNPVFLDSKNDKNLNQNRALLNLPPSLSDSPSYIPPFMQSKVDTSVFPPSLPPSDLQDAHDSFVQHQDGKNENSQKGKPQIRIRRGLQEKTLELAISYNNQSIEAITNFFADLMSFITLCFLLVVMEIQINITKSFLLEVFFGLDDSKKSLLILLVTDLFCGYHSPNIWELFFQFIFNHYGLPESQTGIFLLVATLPVLLDVLFKYLIFRHLNRASPATVATYHAMIE